MLYVIGPGCWLKKLASISWKDTQVAAQVLNFRLPTAQLQIVSRQLSLFAVVILVPLFGFLSFVTFKKTAIFTTITIIR